MFFVIFLSICQAHKVLEETNQPATDTIPLSVHIDQMTANFDQSSCQTQIECTVNDDCDPRCGKQCTANANDHYFQYKFRGQQFQVYGSKGSNLGPINVQFDDQVIEVAINTGDSIDHTLLYTSPVLEYGDHTIKVFGNGNTFTIHKFAYWPSIKAKRLNYTDLGPSGNWVKQSDGIGGFLGWANTDASLTSDIDCSKLWAYGSQSPEYGTIKVSLGTRFKEVSENTTARVDGYLLFESDTLSFGRYRFSVTNPYVHPITFYCVYYDHEDIPVQSPVPRPDPPPLDENSFIDKTYQDYIPWGYLAINDASVINQIKGCTFTNILTDGKFLGAIQKVIEFSDNVFQYTGDFLNPTIFYSGLENKVFEIKRCTFTRFRNLKQNGEGLIATFNKQMTVNLISCTFNNNGQSDGHFMFKFNGENSQITFQSCKFNYDDPNVGSRIGQFEGAVTINDCTFTNSPRDMIRLNPLYICTKIFTFTNNVVQGNTKQFIMAVDLRKLKYKPVIHNNVFQNINLVSGYLITYTNLNNEMELVNNTFSHITTKTDSSYCGSSSQWYQNKENAQITIKYTDCKFYDNSNLNERSPFNQGGAIQYGFSTSISNAAVILDGCEFKRNSSPNGPGGAVAFSIDHNLTIKNCIFENNKAGGAGGAIYFWSKIQKPADNPEAPDFVEPIKIKKISITNCQFSGNEGSNGNGVYIDQYYSLSNTKLEVLNCNFKDNGEGGFSYSIYAVVGSVQFDGNAVEFTAKEKSTGIMKLPLEDAQSVEITNSNFVNCYSDERENIYIDASDNNIVINVLGCNFTDCKPAETGYVIYALKGTINVDLCKFQFESNSINSAAGAVSLGNYKFSVKNSIFKQTYAVGAIKFVQKGDISESPIIDGCVFENNAGSNTRCLNIAVINSNLIFQNSIIRNQRESGNRGYFLLCESLKYSDEPLKPTQDSMIFQNISFLNNRCNCDYGGGSGIWVAGFRTINFINCRFIGNTELKSPEPREQTPTEASETYYYTGDGGGLQYGFSNSIYDVDMVFTDCEFKDNKAVRHGGALALQTCGTVTIERCTFTNNLAGYQEGSTSPSLLNFKNYYSKKTYGRGGAIYINPAFNHKDSNPAFYMKQISITGCTFEKNSAFDGYAMYVQGDDPGTKFTIQSNTFTDNYNSDESKPGEKSIIFSEIKNIDVGQNTFKDITGVDHQPIPINFGEPEDTEDDGPDYFEVINITTSGRHDYVVKDNSQLIITVSISRFNNIRSGPKDGGALYIVNAGLACQDITFDTCTSEKRGGAIFLHNTYNTTNYVNIIRNNISHCSAAVGGGVFIFSSNANNKVTVRDCTFEYNEATNQDSNNLIGGNGLFIAAKKGRVKKNNFVENIGIGSSLHFDNRFSNEQLNTLSVEKKMKFTISDCRFVLSGSSKSAFYYSRGNGGNLVELSRCSFEGKLSKGNHYIDGQKLSDNSPKLIVRNCKFAGNQEQAVPLDSDFVSIDLKGQSFESNIFRIQKKSSASKSALTVVVSSATITVIAVIAFIVFAIKKKNNNDLADNKMSSEV